MSSTCALRADTRYVTLRRVQKGWKAEGRLTAVYAAVGGVKELARLTGIPQTNLSGVNSGKRNLSLQAAHRIIEAVPRVTLLDLGPPAEIAEGPQLILDRLEEHEKALNALGKQLNRLEALDRQASVSKPRPRPRKRRGGQQPGQS